MGFNKGLYILSKCDIGNELDFFNLKFV